MTTALDHLVIPGSEFDASEHASDMAGVLRVARMYGVTVPVNLRARMCMEPHPSNHGYCTRADGHTRRHHQTFIGLVLAVWHQQDW